MRDVFYRVAALLASHSRQTDPTMIDDLPKEAVTALGQLLDAGTITEQS